MTTNGVLERKLVEYLLGGLPPEERADVEEGLFADDELDDELQATRDDLIQAYLAGKLSPQDRARFESHFLASDRHRGRLVFVRDLLAAVDQVSVRDPRVTRQAWLAAAAVVLIAASALVLALRIGQQEGSPDDGSKATTWSGQETAAPKQTGERTPGKSLLPAEPAPVIQTVLFSARAGVEPLEVVLDPETSLLRVRAPVVELVARSYEVILHDIRSREVWRSDSLTQAGGLVVCDVPRAVLTAADYRLTVQAESQRGPGSSFTDFYLRIVERR
jgi:hypothetical protein